MTKFADMFWEQGYLHLPSVFSPERMNDLEKVILEHYGYAPELAHEANFLDVASVEVIPWFPQREGNTAFDQIERFQFLEDVTKEILGEGWLRQYCMVMFSKSNSAGQAWHQDCPPDNPALFNLNRLTYTADVDPAIGGQVVVMPGSHRRGMLSVGDPNEELRGQVVIAPKKGDIILLHGHCWHRIKPVGARHRSSVNFRAAPAGVDLEITDVCVYRNMMYRFSTATVVENRM